MTGRRACFTEHPLVVSAAPHHPLLKGGDMFPDSLQFLCPRAGMIY